MGGSIQVARGAAVGIAIMAVSALFHSAAGGCLDHLTSPRFFLLGAVTVVIATIVSAREWTLVRLLVAVGLGQVAFHYFVEASSLFDTSIAHDDEPAYAPEWTGGALMLASHVLAALLIVVLLRRGEVWLLALVDLIGQALMPPKPWVLRPIAPLPTAVPLDPRDSGFRRILFATAATRRGPPTS